MFEVFEQCEARDFDYVVGWVDAFPRGNALGRGQVHAANYVSAERDPEGARMLSVGSQIPGKFAFGVLPRSWMWFLAKPWAHRLGMRLINWGRFFWASRKASGESHFVSHAQFNFLLDFVPNWKWIYRPGGLIQFQLFLPLEHAKSGFRKAIELQQSLGLESWLMVMKRHRSDAFWLSHAVDGYSLAMDFPVTDRNRAQLFQMTRRFERLVVEANGRFYFAKDAVVSAEAVRRSLGPAILGRFFELKNRVDPKRLLTGNLFRRVFAPLLQEGQGDSERVGPPEAVAVEPTS